MDQRVRVEDLDWVTYRERVARDSPVLFLPAGALEQHGPHLPMICDELIPRRISEMVAERVGGLVAPSLAYGYKSQPRSGGGNHFPGTTSLDGETLIRQVCDVLREFARHGVRRFVLMDGHYENMMFLTEGADLALRELRRDGVGDVKILRISYYEFTTAATARAIWPDGGPSWALEHGGLMETSLMLYLRPDLVDMERVPTHAAAAFPAYDVFPGNHETLPGLPESGALMSARAATADKGERLLREYVAGIADAVAREFGAGA